MDSFRKGHVAVVTVVKKGSSNGSVPASPVAALREQKRHLGSSQRPGLRAPWGSVALGRSY